MELRHRQFINSLVSLADESNRPLIECAIKEYVVLEGTGNFFNRAKAMAGNLKDKIVSFANGSKESYANTQKPQPQPQQPKESTAGLKHREFTPQQEKARQYLIDTDRKTWENDYNRFLQACDDITYFLKTYGNREFNQMRQTPDFKKAEKRGNLMDDYLRLGGPLPRQLSGRTQIRLLKELHLWTLVIIGYYLQFPAAIPVQKVGVYALLSLSPLIGGASSPSPYDLHA